MTNSGFWLYDEPIKNRATGYSYDDDKAIWRSRSSMPVLRGTSAGGWFSTVEDLTKFMKGLLSNKLLTPFYTDKVITAKQELRSPNYGYGFFISDQKLSHGGNGSGISSKLTYYKSYEYTLAILCNYSSGANEVESVFDSELL